MPQTRLTGLIIVLISTVLWSTAGLFVQMADLDTWSVVAWRSVFALLTLGLFWMMATRNKADALRRTLSWPGAGAIAVNAFSGICYVSALKLTSVANVMTVYAALPFVATAVAFVALRERVAANFLVCGLIASTGIVIMSRDAIALDDILGICAALVMTAGFAVSLVQAKKYPFLDMTLVIAAAATVSGLVALPLMRNFAPDPRQLLACALLGALTTGLANLLSLVGGRLIRSGEAGFLLLLDVVLGPLWVWWAFDKGVGTATLIGGGVVMAAVGWYLVRPGKRKPLTLSA